MAENQHRKISGYRELNQTEIDLMNRIKAFGPELETLINDIEKHLDSQTISLEQIKSDPYGWLIEGKTKLQIGLMCLTRSVAQPTTF
jgi:cellobiose-specific phosphotransferase system component IIB